LIDEYLNSWVQKRIDCELQAKNRAKINNEGWRKLRSYHLKRYIEQIENPFGFMFALRYKYKHIFRQVSSANKLYMVTLEKRNQLFEKRG